MFYGRGGQPDKDEFIGKVTRHNEAVKEYFKDRPDDLLVLDVCAGDGWEKLCPFLEKAVPDKPFPHKGKGKYKWIMRKIKPIKFALKRALKI